MPKEEPFCSITLGCFEWAGGSRPHFLGASDRKPGNSNLVILMFKTAQVSNLRPPDCQVRALPLDQRDWIAKDGKIHNMYSVDVYDKDKVTFFWHFSPNYQFGLGVESWAVNQEVLGSNPGGFWLGMCQNLNFLAFCPKHQTNININGEPGIFPRH